MCIRDRCIYVCARPLLSADCFLVAEGVKAPALSGEIEFPVEAILSRDHVDTVRMVAKLCTLTGLSGFAPCSW